VAAKPAVAAPAPTQPAPLQIAPVQIAPPAKPEVAAAPPPQTQAAAAPTNGEDMLVRGIAALETGDIASARLYLERAATVSDPHAALLLGQSYDPAFLKRIGAMGVRGDAAQAAAWYRKALALGEPTAQSHLDGLAVK
jgi:TPR repeat protein